MIRGGRVKDLPAYATHIIPRHTGQRWRRQPSSEPFEIRDEAPQIGRVTIRRGCHAEKRCCSETPNPPDPKFHDILVARFICNVMRSGKKSVAEMIMYNALDLIGEKIKEDPIVVFRKALDNIKPVVEVKSRRVGGATYKVPTDVPQDRRIALAIRWLINYAKARSEHKMEERLAGELIGCLFRSRRRLQEKRRRASHGRGQQRLLLTTAGSRLRLSPRALDRWFAGSFPCCVCWSRCRG